ncbi:hypothetical protein ACH5RR_006654 [Cinchona calisaya]|uniref:Uncharacterized protein n=1 Tax=Cinchona calisaya TaxID=153742 RepID=A0ABD3APX6_9GENT
MVEVPEGPDCGTCNFFKDGDFYPDWPVELSMKPDDISEWTSVDTRIPLNEDSSLASDNARFQARER